MRYLLLILTLCGSMLAQNWLGIIDPTRATSAWSSAGVPGGIPSATWTQCGATIAAGASSAIIQTAINACGANQYVKLGVGTFNLTSGWTLKSNMAVRGSGANQTIVINSGSVGCGFTGGIACFSGNLENPLNGDGLTKTWVSGFAQGTTTITLNNTTGLAVGRYVLLDQLDDSNTDNGAIWICETAGVCVPSTEGPSGGQRTGRAQGQYVKITNIAGNNITFTPGLYMPNWSGSKTPQLWSATTDDLKNAGIEDMSIQENGAVYAIFQFFHASECWIKGVRSIINNTSTDFRNHVNFLFSNHITVRDSYFFNAASWQATSYGIEFYIGDDHLIENNIFHRMAAPLVFNGISAGTVIGYNYNVRNEWCPNENPNACDNDSLRGTVWNHAAGADYILLEGNIGPAFFADMYHGTHYFNTTFRNWWLGWQPDKASDMLPIIQEVGSRYFNHIGNVIGHPGTHITYSKSAAPWTDNTIFTLGWSISNPPPPGDDSVAAPTTMRWGNYDTVNAAVRFVNGEVPTGLANYANAVPVSQTLPASFYLNSKPAWFGSLTWPPIGPDVTGATAFASGGSTTWTSPTLNGHAGMIPAQNCFKNFMGGVADGSGSVLSFNASDCYDSSTTSNPNTTIKGKLKLSGQVKPR